ncbi:MAG TPA: hypothetical protein VFU15_12005 [Bacteroidia bacterium]|nr:hypothetical protein [Bacteroidia bacterium]
MPRIVLFLSLGLLLLSGCTKRWMGVIVKKRVYMDGYYVHIPAKRKTFPRDYVPPSPYPVTYPHTPDYVAYNDTAQPPVYVVPADTTPQQIPVAYNPPDTAGPGGFGSAPPSTPGGGTAGQTPAPAGSNYILPPDTAHSDPSPPVTATANADTLHPSPPGSPVSPDSSFAGEEYPAKKYASGAGDPGDISVFFQLGFINGPPVNGRPVKWNSFASCMGLRYSRNVSASDKIVADAGYRFTRFYFAGDKMKTAPLPQQAHDREKMSLHAFTFALCNRICFAPYRNGAEKWFDVGLYNDLGFHSAYVYADQWHDAHSPDGTNFKTKTRITGLPYIRHWNFGVTARCSTEFFNIFATYRLSRLTGANDFPDLPRFTVGLEITAG